MLNNIIACTSHHFQEAQDKSWTVLAADRWVEKNLGVKGSPEFSCPLTSGAFFFITQKTMSFPNKKTTSSPQTSEQLQAFISFLRILLGYSTSSPISHHGVSSFSKPQKRSPTSIIPFFTPPSCYSNNYTWCSVLCGCSVCWTLPVLARRDPLCLSKGTFLQHWQKLARDTETGLTFS